MCHQSTDLTQIPSREPGNAVLPPGTQDLAHGAVMSVHGRQSP